MDFNEIDKIYETTATLLDEHRNNPELLRHFLTEKRYNLAVQFDDSAYTKEIVDEFAPELVSYVSGDYYETWKNPYGFAIPFIKRSTNFFNYCLDNQLNNLTPFFFGSVYTKDIIENNKDIFLKKIGDDLPIGLSYSEKLLEHCININRFDLVVQFHGESFKEEIVKNNFSRILTEIGDKIPYNLKNCKFLFDMFLEQKKYNMLTQMASEFITEEIINEYGQELLKNIKTDLPHNLSKSITLLIYCLKNDCSRLVLQFDREVYTKDLFEKYGEYLLSHINSENLPYNLKDNQDFLIYCIENNKSEYITRFHEKLYTEEIIEKYGNKIVENLDIYNISSFKNNQQLLNICVLNKRFDLVSKFNPNLYSEELLIKHGQEILDNLRTSDMWGGPTSKIFFEFCISNKRYDLVTRFDETLFTEDIIDKYKENILEEINNYFPQNLKNNIYFFNYCLSQKRFDLIKEFNSEFITDTILNTYTNEIISEIGENIPSSLLNNSHLFNHYLKNQNFDMLLKFDEDFITPSVLDKYGKEIIETCEKRLPYNQHQNKALFDYCLKNKKFSLLSQFDTNSFKKIDLLTEEIIKEYSKEFINAIDETKIISYGLRNSKAFFECCINQKRFDLVVQLSPDFLTNEILQKYSSDLLDNLHNIVDYTNHKSEELLKCCLNSSRYDLIKYFDDKLMNKNIIEQYGDEFLKAFDKNIPYNLKSNPIFLKFCLAKERYDLASLFSANLYSKDIVQQYGEKIIAGCNNLIPITLASNTALFEWCLEKEKYDTAIQFNSNLFNNIILENKGAEIIKAFNHMLPERLKDSISLFKYCIKNKYYDISVQFKEEIYTKDIIEKYGEELISWLDENNKQYLPESLDKNTYLLNMYIEKNRFDMIIKFMLKPTMLHNEKFMKKYIEELGLTKDEFNEKIYYLYSKNDEIYDTLIPVLLKKTYSKIDIKHIEKIAVYKDVQIKILELNEKGIELIAKILDIVDNEKYDMTSVIYHSVDNIPNYQQLIESIDINTITEEQLKNLVTVLQDENNIYNITDISLLTNKNYDKLIDDFFKQIDEKIKNKTITLEELKIALLEKKYGLNLEKAKFLCERYCHNMKELKNSSLNKLTYLILDGINKVFNAENIEYLEFLYITSTRLKTDFYTTTSLESSIRKEYAKLFNDTLYQLNEKHLLNENNELYHSNKTVYDVLSNITYNETHPQIYIMDGDFNLQIHALGAYREWSRPENFKEDWERPKITHHGICTSYIGNNQIANARISHPVYGFAEYEGSALLCAGNYDLFSDQSIFKYATSSDKPYSFYPPKEMIDNTRHTHNELVLERRLNKKGQSFKRTPDYVIYFVDDINNLENFSTENELFSETIQAAVDQNIPIIIVDRLKYAKSEYQKCKEKFELFKSTQEPQLLENIIVRFMNNSIGCINYNNDNSEYHNYFNTQSFEKIYKEIITYINELQVTSDKKLELVSKLAEVLIKEKQKTDDTKGPASLEHNINFNLSKKIEQLEELQKELSFIKTESITQDEQIIINKKRVIIKYYYNQSEEIKNKIKEDLESKIDLDAVIKKIESREYERMLNL